MKSAKFVYKTKSGRTGNTQYLNPLTCKAKVIVIAWMYFRNNVNSRVNKLVSDRDYTEYNAPTWHRFKFLRM